MLLAGQHITLSSFHVVFTSPLIVSMDAKLTGSCRCHKAQEENVFSIKVPCLQCKLPRLAYLLRPIRLEIITHNAW